MELDDNGRHRLKFGVGGADGAAVRLDGTVSVTRRTVSWDAATRVLTVGKRSVALTCGDGDNECILRTYLQLVAEQRRVPLDRSVVLRKDDVVVLAELLDLDDVELESTLARLLRLSAPEAAELRRRLVRTRVGMAVLGVGLLAGVPLGRGLAGADEERTFERVRVEAPATSSVELPATGSSPTTVAAEALVKPEVAADEPAAEPSTSDEPPPTVAPEPEVEIGDALVIERDPDAVPPPGVEIGDALVIERDAP